MEPRVDGRKVPPWAIELEGRIRAGTSPVFILHGGVADYVRLGDRFVTLRSFLQDRLGPAGRVIFYNRSSGLVFGDPETETLFRRATGFLRDKDLPPESPEAARRRAMAALGEQPQAGQHLPQHPTKVLHLVEQAIRSGCLKVGPGGWLLTVIEYAETVVPTSEFSGMSEDDRTNLVTLLRWAADPTLLDARAVVLLTTGNLTDLHAHLRHPGSRIEAVEVPLPTLEERRDFIEFLLRQNGFDLVMTVDQLAHATAGLSRLQIEALLRQSHGRGGSLQFEEVKRRKRETLKQELSDMVEVIEPAHGLEAIGGLEPVKAYLRQVIAAIRDGDFKLVPRGILLMGPPGVGKTALAEALAKECGFNFVKLVNPREKWVGQSERNYWRILQALRALTPLVVLEDEADQSEQSRDEYSGDSGVSNRIRQMRFDFTGDPTIQGKVLWVRISNRPDKLDAAEKRSGRGSERIPLLLPDAEEKRSIFAVMPRKHDVPCAVQDFGRIVEACEARFPDQLSGADLEEISLRAYRRARTRGAPTTEEEDYLWAIEDFIPSERRQEIRRQELLALSLCSSRRFIPERYRDLLREQEEAEETR